LSTIGITGIAGYIGSRLLAQLNEMPEVENVVGIDIRPPSSPSSKLSFYRRDIRSPVDDIFRIHKIDAAIHLAFIVSPTHRIKDARQTDIDGAKRFLEACRQGRVKNILYLSSHTVYGAFADNPASIKEDQPVRILPGFQYSEDKISVERLLIDFVKDSPDAALTILRVCPVIGAHAADSISAVMMKPPMMLRLRGYDPPMQFVHEDDLVRLIGMLMVDSVPGIYNVAGDGEIKYTDIAGLVGKRMLAAPESLVRPLLGFSWKLHLQSQSPPPGLEFIKYPPLVNTQALKDRTGFRFGYSSREAVAAYTGLGHGRFGERTKSG
jgi:UDP-glucose 4-epimerase